MDTNTKSSNVDLTQKSCVILDFDHTLIHAVRNTEQIFEYPPHENHFMYRDHYKIFIRPGTEGFLRNLYERFPYVVYWSAGKDDYVRSIAKRITPGEFEPYCVITRATMEGSRSKHFEKIEGLLPVSKEECVFVDDSPHRIKDLDDEHKITAERYYAYCDVDGLDNYLIRLSDEMGLFD